MILAKKKNSCFKMILRNNNLNELYFRIEEIAYEYLKTLNVVDEKYYKKTKSGQYKTHPFGYFMISTPYKIQIFRKYIDYGYFYNSLKVDKIITFCIILPLNRESLINENIDNDKVMQKIHKWKDIHLQIENMNLEIVEIKDNNELVNFLNL